MLLPQEPTRLLRAAGWAREGSPRRMVAEERLLWRRSGACSEDADSAAPCHAGKDTSLLPKQGDDHIEPFITHWVEQVSGVVASAEWWVVRSPL